MFHYAMDCWRQIGPRLFFMTVLLCLLATAGQGAQESTKGLENLEDSVVRIVNHSQRGDWLSPWNVHSAESGSGSGFVIAGNRVMTNAHVVSDSRMCIIYLNGDPNPHQARVEVIGHDCDLALLEPIEEGLLKDIPPVKFGKGFPEIRSVVETYGYPAGGERLSSTRGVVSRIELQRYSHSALDAHLTVQTDAAINPGNSGGPVVQNGHVVGVAFQVAANLENVGFFIPTEVIEHFLTDAADGNYSGYPELGVVLANMENPAARSHAGMAKGETGVEIQFVFPGSSADKILEPGDVLLTLQDHEVANDGTVAIHGLRFKIGVLVDRLQVGDPLQVTILRKGEKKKLEIQLTRYLPQNRFADLYDVLPRYYVYAGLVFVPLDREVLKTFGNQWVHKADRDLLYELFARLYEEPEIMRREPIMLLRSLDHPVNMNLQWRTNMVVAKVNGRPIVNLETMIAAFETSAAPYHLIEFEEGGRLMALDRDEADRAKEEILKIYGVFQDRRL